jgi:predicted TIM-barrel fold metal-dependent hydrolase
MSREVPVKDYTKETDARIVIDDLLRQAGWDPADKSQVLTELTVYGADRYKPQIAEKPPDEDPAELIRETLTIKREITEGLERLLKEVEQ